MPLYDIICLFKAAAQRKDVVEILASVGKRVYAQNGVVTNVVSYGTQPLGYQIKRQGMRFYEAHLMQMTFMAPTRIVEEFHVLQQDDRLLRHTVLKHKPFWKEEIVDNTAWVEIMRQVHALESDGSQEMSAAVPQNQEEEEDDEFEDEEGGELEDEEDLEFQADEVGETPQTSQRLGASGEAVGSTVGPTNIEELTEEERVERSRKTNEALERWRRNFRARQEQRRREAEAARGGFER